MGTSVNIENSLPPVSQTQGTDQKGSDNKPLALGILLQQLTEKLQKLGVDINERQSDIVDKLTEKSEEFAAEAKDKAKDIKDKEPGMKMASTIASIAYGAATTAAMYSGSGGAMFVLGKSGAFVGAGAGIASGVMQMETAKDKLELSELNVKASNATDTASSLGKDMTERSNAQNQIQRDSTEAQRLFMLNAERVVI